MWNFKGQSRPDFALPVTSEQESVWDYPRPPICVADSRTVTIKLRDTVIASTTSAIRVLETASPPTIYIPPNDVQFDCLQPALGSSFCEWKGSATYWSVHIAGRTVSQAGWSYPEPSNAFQSIASYLSFYPAKVVCLIDGEIVRPQPGGFYGGWVTDEIIGPYKGEPGTSGW